MVVQRTKSNTFLIRTKCTTCLKIHLLTPLFNKLKTMISSADRPFQLTQKDIVLQNRIKILIGLNDAMRFNIALFPAFSQIKHLFICSDRGVVCNIYYFNTTFIYLDKFACLVSPGKHVIT